MGYAHGYATAIMHRGRVPMEPVDFVPDWADGPRKTKHYPGTDRLPLPAGPAYPADATVERGLLAPAGGAGGAAGGGPAFDLGLLGGLLRDSYGLVGRRLGVQANTDLGALPFYPLANWSRGTASGGGLYPVSVYWISGPSAPVPPGVHYYSARHHALRRLLTGDVTQTVRDALGEGAPGPGADQFLVLGVKYWQNSFKYNSFSFHAVSMDVGALLGTWRTWAGARGTALEPALWFDEERLARLLGVAGEEEGIFAVVPLPWDGAPAAPAAPAPPPEVSVRHRDVERSRTVRAFDALTAMHRATAADAAARPAPGALAGAAAHGPDPRRPATALPEPAPLARDVRSALRARRSSFGRFAAERPLDGAHLTACLAAAAGGSRLGGDAAAAGADGLVKLYALVNHVTGVAPGTYEYVPGGESGVLRRVSGEPPGAFLQENYFLANYNLEQAGAVLVPTVRTHSVLDAVGDRGYRLVNALIGGVAQATYTAAAALDVGCGVALGFDNIAYRERFALQETDEMPLLIMMLGHERRGASDFRFEIA
ncbi:nitroreductase family protein [Streptomyces sp. WMMC500]|uniref:nitroreductase family protein n=1 Tax=Streptomyces sp. WMMC500 TaxID=3015154 RepID=UPI00248BF1FD|nr:nitroreductase family protein [Streptomyces sp. WMMC500]WBB64068.1 nitroreductase family protein [Streptomyces sp. WMMC500]